MSDKRKLWIKRAAAFGALLGLTCHLMPPQYETICNVIAAVCGLSV